MKDGSLFLGIKEIGKDLETESSKGMEPFFKTNGSALERGNLGSSISTAIIPWAFEEKGWVTVIKWSSHLRQPGAYQLILEFIHRSHKRLEETLFNDHITFDSITMTATRIYGCGLPSNKKDITCHTFILCKKITV